MGVTLTDIDVGTVADDGTGDTARVAFQAINANNAELESKVEDATEIEALVAGTVRGYTKQQYIDDTQLTDAASITWNLDDAQTAYVTLGGNRTLANPTNMKAGATYILKIEQDSSGSRTLAYSSAYLFPGGTDPVLTTAGGSVDIISFYCDGTSMYGVASLDFS